MSIHCRSEFIRQLVRQEVQTELRRAAAEESAQWDRCFGAHAPKNRSAQVERIIHVASARAVAAQMKLSASSDEK